MSYKPVDNGPVLATKLNKENEHPKSAPSQTAKQFQRPPCPPKALEEILKAPDNDTNKQISEKLNEGVDNNYSTNEPAKVFQNCTAIFKERVHQHKIKKKVHMNIGPILIGNGLAEKFEEKN